MSRLAGAPLDVERLRGQFPALGRSIDGRRLVYLDSACTALKSRAVAERMSDFYLHWGGCGGKRSTHLLSQQVEAWAQEARQAAARFLGACSPNEIVFTSGTTEAANLLARSFPYQGSRREVVLSDLEHNAVFLPFHEAARRGEVELKFCRSREGRLDLEALEGLICERTALVAVTRSSNVYGGVQPLAEISRLAHARGACVFADDAQFVSSHREDVAAVNVDFAAFSAHKIGGPFGLGVLYGKEQLLNGLGRYKVGGGTVKSVSWTGQGAQASYLDAPAGLEAGVQNFGALVGLTEAIALLESLPEAALRAHVGALAGRAAGALRGVSHVRVLGEDSALSEGSLVSFYSTHDDFSITDFNLFLNHELSGHFIAVRAGEHCAHLLHRSHSLPPTMRLSFFAYNTAEEVDLFIGALQAYLKEACR